MHGFLLWGRGILKNTPSPVTFLFLYFDFLHQGNSIPYAAISFVSEHLKLIFFIHQYQLIPVLKLHVLIRCCLCMFSEKPVWRSCKIKWVSL